ncbi:MAG: DNA helicase RecQ [Gammaproteobacteria bacterium]|nr:DNA helicase RecQ [Gammaproteobacteria bacterium]
MIEKSDSNQPSLATAPIPGQAPSAKQILNQTFGYTDFRNHQAEIIATLVAGRDVLTLMPTGGGKSLCYQIPALLRQGTGIVVSPLIALMQDQVDALNQLGMRAAFLNSTLDRSLQQQIEQQLLQKQLDLLYLAPERLLTERTLALLEQTELALFAIDEAHCVSQWGHDFRKDYQQLSILHQRFPQVPRIALTATADRRTRQEIAEQLELQKADQFVSSFDRPNIRYTIDSGHNGRDRLWRFLQQEHPDDAGIVYCLSRRKVEEIAEWLNSNGCKALPYHAGLNAETRRLHQQRFLREEGLIIVATIAFGMGIDKPDVRFVAHLNLPKSVEAYYQETGRAGRDNQPADAWMNFGLQDVITLRQFIHATDADEQYKRIAHHKLEAMLGLCDLTGCRRQALLDYFGESLAQPCGNCDNCISPPETWDATEATRKALSCVYRTNQRFGVNYLIEVLTGKEDERIERNNHHRLTTFGIGKELSSTQWRALFRQLISLGHLDTDLEGHGALKLTQKCRPLLRGETSLYLRQQPRREKKRKTEASRTQLPSWQQPLFDALRQLRLQISQEQGVPPYVIFHDSTLMEMVEARPQDLQQMRFISGVGERKLALYGQQFLDLVLQHKQPDLLNNRLSASVNETLFLHEQGLDIEQIALQRQLKPATVYDHIAEAVAAGLLDVRQILPLNEIDYKRILTAMDMVQSCERKSLKTLYEALDQAYDYPILRCIIAAECR